MSDGFNRERAVFLVGAVLFVWVMVKLYFLWRPAPAEAANPQVALGTLAKGDPNIRERLVTAPLQSYTERRPREDPFFPPATAPVKFYVRCDVTHSFQATEVVSRYTFHCRMTPRPIPTVLFRIPKTTKVTSVISDQQNHGGFKGYDEARSIYVFPVKPTLAKLPKPQKGGRAAKAGEEPAEGTEEDAQPRTIRTLYGCKIEVATETPLPSLPIDWTAPVVCCTGRDCTPNVKSESGEIVLHAIDPTVEITVDDDATSNDLKKLSKDAWGASKQIRGAFQFAKPDYTLAIHIERRVPEVTVRSVATHRFSASSVRSVYTFDCEMTPNPFRELRIHLPYEGTTPTLSSFSEERDRARKPRHEKDKRVYVVPVKPVLVEGKEPKVFRCRVRLRATQKLALPANWRLPAVACGDRDATPKVVGETGHVYLSAYGRTLEIDPADDDPGRTKLTPIPKSKWPAGLASLGTQFAYRFDKPEYTLNVKVQRHIVVFDTKQPPTPIPPIPPTEPILPIKPDLPDPDPKPKIPGPDDDDRPPYKVQVILTTKGPEEHRQAVLRHKETKQYYRKSVGQKIEGLLVASITDDSVVLKDLETGRRFVLAGRLADKYGPD